jgi:hypothetical protein
VIPEKPLNGGLVDGNPASALGGRPGSEVFDCLHVLLYDGPGVSAFVQTDDQPLYLTMNRTGAETTEHLRAAEILIEHGNLLSVREVTTSHPDYAEPQESEDTRAALSMRHDPGMRNRNSA